MMAFAVDNPGKADRRRGSSLKHASLGYSPHQPGPDGPPISHIAVSSPEIAGVPHSIRTRLNIRAWQHFAALLEHEGNCT
jgi:hypothetical protein